MLLYPLLLPAIAAPPSDPPPIAAVAPTTPMSRLTAGSGVRVRARPEPAAAEITRLPIGQRLDVLRVTAAPVVVGAQSDLWYEVATDQGTGWVFAPLTVPLDSARPEDAWLAVTRVRLAALGPMTGAEEADLARFLRRVLWAGRSEQSRGELASAYLQVLAEAMREVPDCGTPAKDPHCKELLRLFPEALEEDPANNSGLLFLEGAVLDEVGGLALGTPFAEPVAWIRVNTAWRDEVVDLPGVLTFVQLQEERYLRDWPDGPHVGEILARVERAMDPSWAEQMEWTAELRSDVHEDLAALRAVVGRTHHPSTSTVLAAIDREVAAVGAPPTAPKKAETPLALIHALYGVDGRKGDEPPHTRALDVALHHTACWEGVPYPGLDYATASQDPMITDLSIRQVPAAVGATIEVRFLNYGAPALVRWDLIEEEGEWRVVTVRGESGTLKYDLKADAATYGGSCPEYPDSGI